jgi:hypothetical protein
VPFKRTIASLVAVLAFAVPASTSHHQTVPQERLTQWRNAFKTGDDVVGKADSGNAGLGQEMCDNPSLFKLPASVNRKNWETGCLAGVLEAVIKK